MKKLLLFFVFILVCISFTSSNITNIAFADDLSDVIEEGFNNLDLTALQEFLENLSIGGDKDVLSIIYDMVEGKFEFDYNSFFQYFVRVFVSGLKDLMPAFITFFTIVVFCAIINSAKGSFFSEETASIIFFVCFLFMLLIFSTILVSYYKNTVEIVKNIGKFCEIVSPIILTLMVATGGNSSVAVFRPAVAIMSSGIIQLVLYVILPLVMLNFVFMVMSNFSESVKLKKFSEFFSSLIKWIIGLSITIFGVFLSIQGLASGVFDGMSTKAAKYAISNSIPIIGGFLKDGFDLVVAGSILIKNALGISSLMVMFYYILSPVLEILVFSLLLKLAAAITEPITENRVSDFCSSISKCMTFLIVSILFVAFMTFLIVLLMIFSVNSFI